jgi:hypothetical protein
MRRDTATLVEQGVHAFRLLLLASVHGARGAAVFAPRGVRSAAELTDLCVEV